MINLGAQAAEGIGSGVASAAEGVGSQNKVADLLARVEALESR